MHSVLPPHCPLSQLPENIPACTRTGNRKTTTGSSPGNRSKRHLMPRKAHGNRVLLFGNLRELALYRAEVLLAEGFTVSTPNTKDEAVAAIRRGNLDVAV